MVIFNEGLYKVAEQYLEKGSQIYLEGKLQTRKWKDQQNVERYSLEIVLQGFQSKLVMLDGSKKIAAADQSSENTSYDFEDEIPF